MCRRELSSKLCLGGQRQHKLGSSPREPPGVPSATSGDSDARDAAPIWPGLSQERSPTAGTQKRGGQTTAGGSGREKTDHSKASFDLCLAHVQNLLFQKIPWESATLASSFKVLTSGLSLWRATAFSSAPLMCSLKMSPSNSICRDSNALMLRSVSSPAATEACNEVNKSWEYF